MKKQHVSRRDFLTRLALVPPMLAVGRIELQANPLPAVTKGYVSLFDGKSLAGWHTNKEKISHGTGGRWRIEKGTMISEQDPPGSGNGGVLLTDKKYGDFELEVDVNPDWGIDSGIFFRCKETGECFQIYLDYHDNGLIAFISTEGRDRMYIRPFCIDGILDSKGHIVDFTIKPDSRDEAWKPGFLTYHCPPETWKKAWKIGKWNTIRIRCTGQYPHVTTWMNNVKIMEFDGETCPSPIYRKEMLAEQLGREGYIGLQVHGGTDSWKAGAVCRWKNIRIREL